MQFKKTRLCLPAVILFFSSQVFAGVRPVARWLACDTAYAGADQLVCGDSAMLIANEPVTGTGTWTLLSGSGTMANAANDSTAVTGLAVGQSIFVWTITGGGCPTVSDTVVLSVDSIPTAAAAGIDFTVCADSVVLSGNTPVVGSGGWSLISGSGTIVSATSPNTTVTNLGAGANVFRWKIASGACASLDDVVITRDLPTVAASAGPDQVICDTTGFLGGNTPPFGTGMWTLISGNATIAFPTNSGSSISGMAYGDTAVFVWTLSNGVCPSSSDTAMVITDIPPTFASAGADQVVCAANTVFPGNAPATGTGTWLLVSGSGSITLPNNANSPVTSLGPGENIFVWSIANGVCPAVNDTISIFNNENSIPDAGPDQVICSLASSLAADTPTVGSGVWTLVSGAGSILSSTSPSTIVSNLAIGQNVFAWTISNGICPSRADTVIITVNAPSTNANAGPDFTVCGTSALLSGSSPVNGTGTWTVLAGSGTFSSPNSGSTTVSGLNAGTNTFVWTIVNGTCPASSDTVNVTSELPPAAAFAGADTTICADSIQLNANSPAAGTGAWTAVTAGPSVSAAGNPAATALNLAAGQNVFVWTISSGTTCPASTDTVIITVDEYPTTANAGADISSDQVIITLAGNDPATGTGAWNNLSAEGNILAPNNYNSSFIVTESGEFTLTWTISNGVCPSSTDTVHIEIEFDPIPEIITPNGDGQNDVFLIKALQFNNNIRLSIFNRWGNIVYYTEDYKHDFDGRNNAGVELEEDSYFYQVEANGIEKFKGYLLIKRK